MYVQSSMQSGKVKPNLRIVEQSKEAAPRRKPVRLTPPTEPVAPAIPIGMKLPDTEAKTRSVSALKMILISILVAIAGLTYINHVFHTQKLHAEVQRLQREHDKARRFYADRKFTYDRMTGPAEVYARARQIGLVYSNTADPVLILKD